MQTQKAVTKWDLIRSWKQLLARIVAWDTSSKLPPNDTSSRREWQQPLYNCEGKDDRCVFRFVWGGYLWCFFQKQNTSSACSRFWRGKAVLARDVAAGSCCPQPVPAISAACNEAQPFQSDPSRSCGCKNTGLNVSACPVWIKNNIC